jgi:hypothetical protein
MRKKDATNFTDPKNVFIGEICVIRGLIFFFKARGIDE